MPPESPELIDRLSEAKKRLVALGELVRIDDEKKRIADLEGKMSAPGFWDNPEKAQGIIQELKNIREIVVPLDELTSSVTDTLELAEMAASEGDNEAAVEISAECERAEGALDDLELRTTLNEKHDSAGAFLTIHAGEGGTESCDWASILSRMYERFAEKQGWKVTLVDRLEGEEAGIRNATYQIKGDMVYGHLRSEIGVHRLVRKSPFDSRNRRHTSFASVALTPELPDADAAIEVNETDLRIDTYRAGGAGGQHVNTTDSAVRITHLPTGIVVQCQNERSQHANKATALKQLKSALVMEREREREKELQQIHGEKADIGFGSQIRNYVMEPYTLCKDRRTNVETGNVQNVLDGDLQPFIEAYLRGKGQEGAAAAAPPPADDESD